MKGGPCRGATTLRRGTGSTLLETMRYVLTWRPYCLFLVVGWSGGTHLGEDAVAERRVDGTQVLVVMEKVEVSLDEPQSRAILTWKAGPESDMWADSVLSVVLQVEGSPEVVTFTHSKKCNHAKNDEERGPKVEEVPEAEPAAVTVDDPLEEILADARPSAPLDPADDSDATPIRDASSPEPPFSRTLRLLLERMFGECSRDTSGVLHVSYAHQRRKIPTPT